MDAGLSLKHFRPPESDSQSRTVLVLHDKTEFSVAQEHQEAIGILYRSCGRKDKENVPPPHDVRHPDTLQPARIGGNQVLDSE
jgi:hypothetical protein